MNNSSLSLALAAAVVVVCAACTPSTKQAAAGPVGASPSASRAAVATTAAGLVPASTAAPTPIASDYAFSQDPGPQAPSATAPAPGASWSATAKADALVTATKAMELFARPEAGNVPVHQVLGAGTLVNDAGNPFGAVITFSNDAGTYSVQVVRSGDAAPWQVATIAPAGN